MAVLVAAIVTMVLGYIWFGPLFGKLWMRLNGFTMETMSAQKGKMAQMYIIMFIGALVTAYVLAGVHIFASAYLNIGGIDSGILAGFMSWLGFTAPVTVNYTLTTQKSWKLWAVNSGYYLVSFVVMGIILAVWA
jgi:hypothetical protein